MAGHDPLAFLRRVQEEAGGVIPFERFMQEALYHPSLGYYSAHIRDVGTKGDFSTSATLDERLGRGIAAWIERRGSEFGWKRIPVVEVGAGNGALARSVLRHLGWITRLRTDYMIHETSPVLLKRQKRVLRWRGVRWIQSLPEALDRSGGRALIFSNELVDAFPCRLFQRSAEGWEELGIHINPDGSLNEVSLGAPVREGWFATFEELSFHPSVGQRVERHDSYRRWMESWASRWKEGAALTIDYGDAASELYKRRPEGSLRAYWKHRRFTGLEVYARFGKQDLTADVNFSDLIAWGEAKGWKTSFLTTQRDFMSKWLQRSASTYPSACSPCQTNPLIPQDGAEDAFRVLEQISGSRES